MEETLRVLVALALAFFLIILRSEAETFGAAEYDETTRDGRRASILQRLSYFLVGFALVGGIYFVHPDAQTGWASPWATGRPRSSTASCSGRSARSRRSASRTFATVGCASRPPGLTRAPSSTRWDSLPRRGDLPGCRAIVVMLVGINPVTAVIFQAFLYTLATRIGAPGRYRYMFVLTLAVGLAAGWADRRDRGDRGGLPGPRDHPHRRLRVHRATPASWPGAGRRSRRPGSTSTLRPGGGRPTSRRSRGSRPGERGGAGGSVPSGRGCGGAATAGRDRAAARRDRAGRPATPPVALYVHVPFCRSLCPYCDFVVYAGAIARGPRSRVAAFLAALGTELDLRAGALDAAFGPPAVAAPGGSPSPTTSRAAARPAPWRPPASRPAARRSIRSTSAAARRRSCRPTRSRSSSTGSRAGSALRRGAEVTLEANPGPDDRGDLAGFARAGVTRLSLGAQSLDAGGAPGARSAAPRRRRRRRGWRGPRRPGIRAGEPGPPLRRAGPVACDRWTATLEAALAPRAGPRLRATRSPSTIPDAEGLTGPEGDHLPTPPGARRWRERARGGPGRGPGGRRLRARRRAPRGAGYAWYELSNWARPGRESRHNLAYWTRRPYEAVGPGAHAFDGATRRWNAARLNGWLAALAPAPTAPRRRSRPADRRRSMRRRRARRPSSWVSGPPRGVARGRALTRPEALAWAAEAGLVEDGPRRSRPPDAPGSPALQRGLRPADLTGRRGSRVDAGSAPQGATRAVARRRSARLR